MSDEVLKTRDEMAGAGWVQATPGLSGVYVPGPSQNVNWSVQTEQVRAAVASLESESIRNIVLGGLE